MILRGFFLSMSKIDKDKEVVAFMIRLYCHKKEGNMDLCDSCKELLRYSEIRLEHCRFGDKKPSCKSCKVHCYRSDMRERMKQVMRFSGPRMLLYAPVLAFNHFFLNK